MPVVTPAVTLIYLYLSAPFFADRFGATNITTSARRLLTSLGDKAKTLLYLVAWWALLLAMVHTVAATDNFEEEIQLPSVFAIYSWWAFLLHILTGIILPCLTPFLGKNCMYAFLLDILLWGIPSFLFTTGFDQKALAIHIFYHIFGE